MPTGVYIRTEKTRQSLSKSHQKPRPWRLGKKFVYTPRPSMKGRIPWNKGKAHPGASYKRSFETKNKMSIAAKNKPIELHSNWQGGKSFEKYPLLFNEQLKEKIRARDNFICQICGVPELEFTEKLQVHHIDYEKNNLKEDNLISLCFLCHLKTNFKREQWKKQLSLKVTLKVLI
jgi:hypothetical protein